MALSEPIPSEIIPSVAQSDMSSRDVLQEFMDLAGQVKTKWQIAGDAKNAPESLFKKGLKPKHKIELFDTQFYLTDVLQIPELRFFVAYVVQSNIQKTTVSPRIFYKDLSLCWRSASHFAAEDDGDIWVGKGDVRETIEDGESFVESVESTTDLPLEMQTAVENLLLLTKKAKSGTNVLSLVLKKSPPDRVEPYHDFTASRKIAAKNPANRINRGRIVADFKRTNDPESLWFAKGFEPDFSDGIIERSYFKSRLYGGKLLRVRVLSTNRRIQYFFFAGRKHVWIIPPQALTTELSSYGVRTVDVLAHDDVFIPGYEYHHMEDTKNGPELYSQIPPGYAGKICKLDDAKADASPWLDKLPIVKRFRKQVLNR